MQELRRHQVKGAVGKAVGQIVVREIDTATQPTSVSIGASALQRNL